MENMTFIVVLYENLLYMWMIFSNMAVSMYDRLREMQNELVHVRSKYTKRTGNFYKDSFSKCIIIPFLNRSLL